MTANATKNERINLRLNQSARQLIERATTFEGKTVSGFILASALDGAEKMVHAHERSRLNAKDARRFFNALSKPAEFDTKLTEALLKNEHRVDSE